MRPSFFALFALFLLAGCGVEEPSKACPRPSTLAPEAITSVYKTGYSPLSEYFSGVARDINASGRIVGFVDIRSKGTDRKPYGFAVDADQGGFTDLHDVIPQAINDSGWV